MILSAPLLSAIIQLILLLPFTFLAKQRWAKEPLKLAGTFAFLFLLWSVLTNGLSGIVLFEGQKWNWVGKTASLLVCVFFIYRSKLLSLEEIGWTFRFKVRSLVPVVVLLVLAISLRLIAYFSLQTTDVNFDRETILFQATLSPIAEEIFFRGILLAILNRIFTWKEDLLGFQLSWPVLLTSLLFAFTQGLILQDGYHFQVNLFRILLGLLVGLIASLLKEKSGSLVPAVLFHALWNLVSNH